MKTITAGTNVNTLKAYKATGTLNLASYQYLTFWIKNNTAVLATHWKLQLCTGADGTGPVDEFIIPAIPSTSQWVPLTIAPTAGGNLSNGINSIGLFSGSVTPTAGTFVYIDNISASKTNDINLNTLITQNALETGGTEAYWPIQSIKDTLIVLDTHVNAISNIGQGYYGTSGGSIATYIRPTTLTALAALTNTSVQTINESGSFSTVAGSVGRIPITYAGGYSVVTNTQTGETIFDGRNGFGRGLYSNNLSYVTFDHISVVRYGDNGIGLVGTGNGITVTNVQTACGCTAMPISTPTGTGMVYNNIYSVANNGGGWSSGAGIGTGEYVYAVSNIGYGIAFGADFLVQSADSFNNTTYGFQFGGGTVVINTAHTAMNRTSGLYQNTRNNSWIRNALIEESASTVGIEVTTVASYNSWLFSWRHDQQDDNFWMFTDAGTVNSTQVAGKRHTASGVAWQCSPLALRNILYPLDIVLAEVAVASGTLVTVKCWVLKDHATNIVAQLVVSKNQLTGITTDQITTKADDTDYQELTVTFTPSQVGVVKIIGRCYYYTGLSSVYFDDLTITQA